MWGAISGADRGRDPMGAPHVALLPLLLLLLLFFLVPPSAPQPHCDGDGWEHGQDAVKAAELPREQPACGRPMAVGSRRNVGGEDAAVGQWPWQGSLQRDGTHICGVSLVAPQWVLTAAHCFQGSLDPRKYAVLLGVQELSGPWAPNTTVPLGRLLPHPAYAGEATSGDIALAQLAWPVTYGATVAPVCLPGPTLNFPAGTRCVATGWGDIGEGEDLPSPRRLQEVAVPLMAQAQCRRLYGTHMGTALPPRRVRDDMICAGYPQGVRDTCKGDSGGPLVCPASGRWVLVGVVSWGEGCALPNRPGVYTRVSSYAAWVARRAPGVAFLNSAAHTAFIAAPILILTVLIGAGSCL